MSHSPSSSNDEHPASVRAAVLGDPPVARGREEDSARRAAQEHIRARIERRHQRERSDLRRHRPGPGGFPRRASRPMRFPRREVLDNEILAIQRALGEHGPTERQKLADLVGTRYWGPGVFRETRREAAADGDIRRTSRNTYAPADDDAKQQPRASDGLPPADLPNRVT